MATITLGDYEIEYSYAPGEAPSRHSPGEPDDVEIISVTVGMHTFDEPAEVFSEALLDDWADRIVDHERELERRAREEAEADAIDAARDARFDQAINDRFGVFAL